MDYCLIDSIHHPPDDWDITIENTVNPVASTERDTTGHGTGVLQVAQFFAPDAGFHFYRLLTDTRDQFTVSNLLKAFEYCRDNEIDVVNLSAGKWRPTCRPDERCRLCATATKLASQGVHLVAGAGNVDEGNTSIGVYCPAASPGALAVGTSIVECTFRFPTHTPGGSTGHYAPNAYWIRYPDEIELTPEVEGGFGLNAYCSCQGCLPGAPCDSYRKESVWDGNVTPDTDEIDVLAPGPYPSELDGVPILDLGTSYPTPIVSGVIATLLSHVSTPVPPARMKDAIKSASSPVGGDLIGRLHVDRTVDRLF